MAEIEDAAVVLADAIRADAPSAQEPSDAVVDARARLLSAVFHADARPDYVKCVAGGRLAVCGRSIVNEFHFLNWEHADRNEADGGRLVTCPTCKAVRAGIEAAKGDGT